MTRRQKTMLIRIIVSALLFAGAFFTPDSNIVHAAAFAVPLLVVGYDVLYGAVAGIFRGELFDEKLLMCIACVGAFCIGEYPEAAAVMLFFQTGELFQSVAVERSRRSIAELMDIRPDRAHVERGGETVTVEPCEVAVGEIIVVSPGERIPLDGVVISGEGLIDTSALTGESAPREAAAGSSVISGCVGMSGVLRIRTERTSDDSTVTRILELVETASDKKAPSESFITKFARWYTPAVVGAAVLLAAVPTLAFEAEFSVWLHRALLFLVVSCPCALVISVPLSFFGGIGGASRRGILVKGGGCIETLSRVETLAFDKTGTLTEGAFEVSETLPENGADEKELLSLAACAESHSSHPIAVSIRAAAEAIEKKSAPTEIAERSGLGVSCVIDGARVCVGSGRFIDSLKIPRSPDSPVGTTIHVAENGVYKGRIVISDRVKSGAREALSELSRNLKIRTVMLTGDNDAAAAAVAESVGVSEYRAGLLPADKVARLEELLEKKSKKGAVAFVGDGINDAPVLTRADCGIAMGALGSDAAIEAADVVLMNDRLEDIVTAVRISKKTLRIVRQNIVFALAVKLIVMVLGAVGIATMWEAVFADVGVSVIAILNATRALRLK